MCPLALVHCWEVPIHMCPLALVHCSSLLSIKHVMLIDLLNITSEFTLCRILWHHGAYISSWLHYHTYIHTYPQVYSVNFHPYYRGEEDKVVKGQEYFTNYSIVTYPDDIYTRNTKHVDQVSPLKLGAPVNNDMVQVCALELLVFRGSGCLIPDGNVGQCRQTRVQSTSPGGHYNIFFLLG